MPGMPGSPPELDTTSSMRNSSIPNIGNFPGKVPEISSPSFQQMSNKIPPKLPGLGSGLPGLGGFSPFAGKKK
jgi:hypothetical protein